MEEAEILEIEKTPEKRAIKIADDVYEEIRRLIVCAISHDTKALLNKSSIISKYYLGKIFYKNIDIDLVVLYNPGVPDDSLQELKDNITQLFKSYMIDPAYLVFMPMEEFDKRTKMADKFALQVMRSDQ